MQFKLVLRLSALLILPFSASAREKVANDLFLPDFDTGWLYFLEEKTVSMIVYDRVSDGCWKNAEATKTAVKLEFIRSGYTVIDTITYSSPVIVLQSFGYKTAGSECISSSSLGILVHDYGHYTRTSSGTEARIASLFLRDLTSVEGLVYGPPIASSKGIKESFIEMSQKMLVTITDKKQKLKGRIAALPDSEAKQYWTNHFSRF